MGKRKNKRANAKMKHVETGESAGGSRSLPIFLTFFFFGSRFALAFFTVPPLSRSLEQARLLQNLVFCKTKVHNYFESDTELASIMTQICESKRLHSHCCSQSTTDNF